MTYITRAEWGARRGGALAPLSVSTVTIHWAGTPSGNPSHSHCDNVVASFQAYHMDTQRWADIAYNLLVCAHGDIYEGRGLGKRSAANGDGPSNSASYAICYLLGSGEPFTDEAKEGINAAAEMLVPGTRYWKVHQDWVSTGCPGAEITEWVRSGHPSNVAPNVPCKDQVMREGDEGICVRFLQDCLIRRGVNIVSDGDFGPKTRDAVTNFQRSMRLPADGVVNATTWRYLTGQDPLPTPLPPLSNPVLLVCAVSNQVLEVGGGSKDPGAKVNQWACNFGEHQHWQFVEGGDGRVVIVNRASQMALDLDGDRVVQRPYTGATSQWWRPDGHSFVSALSGKALDIPGSSRVLGTPLQQWEPNGSAAQMFIRVVI